MEISLTSRSSRSLSMIVPQTPLQQVQRLIRSLAKSRNAKVISLTTFVQKKKQQYEGLGQALEVFDTKKHEQEKLRYAADLRVYFIVKMLAEDMRTIEQLVKINCLVNLDDSAN